MITTFEGIDSSGTTSVSNRVAQRIGAQHTAEPSDTWMGQFTRESFEERDAHDLTRFYLFMADRVEHYEQVIEPALDRGKTVVCDRGPDSTRAYQYHTAGLSEEFIERNLAKTVTPDVTFWLDVDVDTAIERVEGKDAFENRELQEKVNERYGELWREHDRIIRIDATQDLTDVVDDVVDAL